MKMPILLALLLCFGTALAQDIALPAPRKTGGAPLFEAIDNRSSARQNDFPSGKIGEQELSTLLWAASGLNRDGSKWVVPMAMGKEPYCKVYIADGDGAYLYNWRNHSLAKVADGDCIKRIPSQAFGRHAPLCMVVVGDDAELSAIKGPAAQEFAVVLAGAMSQNVYLAADSLGIGARLVYSIDRDETSRLLKLAPGDNPYFAIILGKK